MFSDRLVDLVKLGVITNSMKKMRPGKIVTSFVIGTKKSFDFLDNNPFVGKPLLSALFVYECALCLLGVIFSSL